MKGIEFLFHYDGLLVPTDLPFSNTYADPVVFLNYMGTQIKYKPCN